MSVDVNSFINFCHEINTRDYLNRTYAIFPDKLNELKRQSEDKNLYLGIVGEFSSGKSTLINAILRQNLLKEDVLQGTTCAPTFIRFDKKFDILVEYSDGRIVSFWDNCNDRSLFKYRTNGDLNGLDFDNNAIRSFIDKYTATEEYSALLDKVTVYINNPVLQNNLVIVDTPGINANDRHSTITKQTLEKYCDAAIILTPANAPNSAILCDFVRNNLSGLENRCIGIVSKIDTMRRPKEQDEQVNFVKQRFNSELGKPLAAVLPISAVYAHGANDDMPPIKPELEQRYKDMFVNFEKTIHERLIKGREKILAQSMRQSVLEVINTLQKVLEHSQTSLRSRRQNLENNQLTDMDTFLDRLVPNYIENFNAITYQVNLQEIFDNAADYTVQNILQDLNLCESRSQIENVANRKLESRCKQASQKVIDQLKSIQGKFSKWSEKTCKDFQDKFSAEFRNLSREIQFTPMEINALTEISSNIQSPNVSFDFDYIGKGAGYIISGILGGPLGIGLFAAFDFLFWNINSAREKAWEQMCPVIDAFFNQLIELINGSYNNILEQSYNSTLNYLSWIVNQYEPTINQIINEERYALNQLQSQQDYLSRDLARLRQFESASTDF